MAFFMVPPNFRDQISAPRRWVMNAPWRRASSLLMRSCFAPPVGLGPELPVMAR
jgi:hypothetical protein